MIVGLQHPDSGEVFLNGENVTAAADVRARAPGHRLSAAGGVGLPQAHGRGEHPRHPGDARPRRRASAGSACGALLDELGIARLAKSKAYSLSGGERRRLEITRALVISPSFMLLDEPFAGIDPIAVVDIQGIVTQLKTRGIGVLITDHNVRETLGICDRAYIVNEGEVLEEGRPAHIAEQPARAARSTSVRSSACSTVRSDSMMADDPARPAAAADPAARDDAAAAAGHQDPPGVARGARDAHRPGAHREPGARGAAADDETPKASPRCRRSTARAPTEEWQHRGAAADEVPQASTIDQIDWKEFAENYSQRHARRRAAARRSDDDDERRPALENTLVKRTLLPDHLMWQLRLSDLSDAEKELGALIIGSLDADGYLTLVDRGDRLPRQRLAATPRRVERVLAPHPGVRSARRRRARPAGVPADPAPPARAAPTTRCRRASCAITSPLLESRRFDRLAKELGVPLEQIAAATKVISRARAQAGARLRRRRDALRHARTSSSRRSATSTSSR